MVEHLSRNFRLQKFILIFFGLLSGSISVSCITTVHDELLADGKTWKVSVQSHDCAGIKIEKSTGDCSLARGIEAMNCNRESKTYEIRKTVRDYSLCEKGIENRGRVLCGGEPERVFGCLVHVKNDNYLSCYVKCK